MEVKDRPLLMQGTMVSATLEDIKTQTRRMLKPFGTSAFKEMLRLLCLKIGVLEAYTQYIDKCPYGQPGDRLWVRETFKYVQGGIVYKASPDQIYKTTSLGPTLLPDKWKPSIHMPRAVSRILLEITDIRVERIRDIKGCDAVDEGWPRDDIFHLVNTEYKALRWFKDLWESIHGADAWRHNDWVWVIVFKRLKG